MAHLKITTYVPDDDFISVAFNYDMNLTVGTRSMTVFEGSEADQGSVTFEGHKLYYQDGKLVSGIVTKISFENAMGDALGIVTNLHFNLQEKIGTLQGVVGLLATVLEGDDKITGSRESDRLYGGTGADVMVGLNGADTFVGYSGNDRMTGSLGSDQFYFDEGDGRDIITDFDAVGGGTDQDYIMNLNDAYIILGRGDDTVIDFGDGDKVILLGVDVNDVSSADIGPFVAT